MSTDNIVTETIKGIPRRHTILVSFGCPRSGTTYMQMLFAGIQGYVYMKMGEFVPCHPCQSDNGLLRFAEMCYKSGNFPIFVRTYRAPAKVKESVKHADEAGLKVGRVNRDGIDHVIKTEEENYLKQAFDLPCPVIEIDFDKLNEIKYRESKMKLICRYLPDGVYDKLMTRLSETFNKKPVRRGRLSDLGEKLKGK